MLILKNVKKRYFYVHFTDICNTFTTLTMNERFITLGEFIIKKQEDFPYSSGELTRLMNSIRLAAKIVSQKVNQAGLVDITGAFGKENVQGEQQQKLDVFANDVFIQTLTNREIVCGIGSEENDDFITICGADGTNSNKYIVLMDPLDGSSNIDVNVSVGTIFSIYRRVSEIGTPVTKEDFLQKGIHQVAAGYVIYGSSTMLVYTTGNGVNGFTLDPALGTFFLSHPDMKISEHGTLFSVNEGNFNQFDEGVKDYINFCKDDSSKEAYSSRYIGSLVADVHRNLLKGGIYMYPGTVSKPNGKLRLLYECNPFAMIIEQAGGKATDGKQRIMEIDPQELHQRVPFFCGSTNMMNDLEHCLNKKASY